MALHEYIYVEGDELCGIPGVLCQRAEGGFCGVYGAGGEADGSSSKVLLP